MASHCSILAWRIPWTKEPGGLSLWGRKESDTTEQLNNNRKSKMDLFFTPYRVISKCITDSNVN